MPLQIRTAAALAVLALLAACATTPRPASRTAGASLPPSIPKPAPKPRGPVSDTPVKIGKAYQVGGIWYYPADEAGYDEVGYASWYGDAFHGGPTANGEIFDMNIVGAAHKTLPLPSYVEVTALETGKTVLVRINDRGPFVTNRIIDLSRRAAEQLGVARQGVAKVRVRRVYPSESDRLALRSGKLPDGRADVARNELLALNSRFEKWKAAQTPVLVTGTAVTAPTPSAPPSTSLLAASAIGGYYVQIASLGDRDRAKALADQLGASIEQAGTIYRIRTGPYFDEQIALAALAQAQGQGYQDARLIRPAGDNRPRGLK